MWISGLLLLLGACGGGEGAVDGGPAAGADAAQDGAGDVAPDPGDGARDGVAGDAAGPLPLVLTLGEGRVRLTVDRVEGTFGLTVDGFPYLVGATSGIETGPRALDEGPRDVHVAAGTVPGGRPATVRAIAGGATEIRLEHPDRGVGAMTTVLVLLGADQGVTVRMEWTSPGGVADLSALLPVTLASGAAGLHFRSAPAALQILQDGSEIGIDHYVALVPGDTPYRRGFLTTLATSRASAASNWNALVYDRAHAEGLHAGFLTFERVVPQVVVGWVADGAPAGTDGVPGFAVFDARCPFLIPRAEPAGVVVASEEVALDVFAGRPQDALERHAQRVAKRYPPPPAKPPVVAWDSWYAHSDAIDEELLRSELALLVDAFGDYGLNTFVVDLGWEMLWGSWRRTPPGFPSGMDAMAAEIRAAGLVPELWLASFDAMADSDALTEHPEWEAPAGPILHALAQPGAKPLDLSQPEVVAFVRETAERAVAWGYEAAKFDFAYYELFVTALADPAKTVLEAYREALAAFADGLGADGQGADGQGTGPYFTNILLLGTNAGLADSMRIGIDTWPCWGDDPDERCPYATVTTGYGGMGLRIAVKTLARRYYWNQVTWVNHPDQVFFREHLSLGAQRAWATLVALSGGVISLGDPAADLTADAIDTFRRLIPNLGSPSVPYDLFEREYPEVWVTSLGTRTPPGVLLQLYDWGTNRDLTTVPPTALAEEPREHEVRLADLGLHGPYHAYEYWTQTDLGVLVDDTVRLTVPPRDVRVVVLRPARGRPYVVTSNRHVSQGGVDVHDPVWSDDAATLTWIQDVVAGFPHTIRVAPASQETPPFATVTGPAEAVVRRDGALWAVDLTAEETGWAEVVLSF